jgi:hypothetical protein
MDNHENISLQNIPGAATAWVIGTCINVGDDAQDG